MKILGPNAVEAVELIRVDQNQDNHRENNDSEPETVQHLSPDFVG